MRNSLFKSRTIVLVFSGVIVLVIFLMFFTAGSKFQAGECVQATDGYIWHVNKYSSGKYSVMGWQNNGWGNEVEIDKNVLERKETSGVEVYHRITCPEYKVI